MIASVKGGCVIVLLMKTFYIFPPLIGGYIIKSRT